MVKPVANLASTSRVDGLDVGHTQHRDRFEAHLDLRADWLA